MKTLKHTLFFLLITIWSCNQELKPTVDYAVVSGKLENVNGKEIKIYSRFTSISFDSVATIQKTLKVDDTGVFTDTLFINGPQEFSISKERSFVGFTAEPGKHIEFTADSNDFRNTTQFNGDAAAENTYLNKKEKIKIRISDNKRGLKYGDEVSFIVMQEAEENEYLDLLNSIDGLSSEFIENEKKDILYNKVMSYIYYPISYERSNDGKKPELSDDFYNILSSVNFQDFSEFQRSTMYQFLLRSYFNTEYGKKVENTWTADPIKMLELIKTKVTNKKVLDELFIMFAKNDIPRSHNLQEYYDFFTANVSNSRYINAVTKQYEDLVATQPGKPSPEFIGYKNINGGTNSLRDYRGKYVYIDVWATWCGPCKAEIPFLKEVEKKYHNNKSIEFISLSIDRLSDTEKWEKFVKKEALGGVQLLADKDWKSEFVQKYQIKGIPQFILIDPEGNIVQASAPRPSNPDLIKLFNEIGI